MRLLSVRILTSFIIFPFLRFWPSTFFIRWRLKPAVLFVNRDAKIDGTPLFLSEYGGFGWYKAEGNAETTELIKEYTKDILDSGLFCGYCYTQLYDVGSETNGLLTADRRPKVDTDAMRKINDYRA